jgi:hypothetical protein
VRESCAPRCFANKHSLALRPLAIAANQPFSQAITTSPTMPPNTPPTHPSPDHPPLSNKTRQHPTHQRAQSPDPRYNFPLPPRSTLTHSHPRPNPSALRPTPPSFNLRHDHKPLRLWWAHLRNRIYRPGHRVHARKLVRGLEVASGRGDGEFDCAGG